MNIIRIMTSKMQVNDQDGQTIHTMVIQYIRKYHVIIICVIALCVWLIYILKQYYRIASNRFLVKDIVDLNQAIVNGNTLDAIRLIRKNPKAINIVWGPEGFTPFLRACVHGNTVIVKYMILLGADLRSCTKRKENGFYLAIYERVRDMRCSDATCIHTLYHAGVDINACNEKGFNSLQLAATFGHTNLVQWLLSKNANYMIKPSPYTLAKSGGHRETANILKPLHKTLFPSDAI